MDFARQLSNIPVPRMGSDIKRFYYLMYVLQSEAGLTYKEARTVLRDLHGDSIHDLAEEFGCTTQAIYGFDRKGLIKAETLDLGP